LFIDTKDIPAKKGKISGTVGTNWIELCKKVFPRYEIKERSHLRVVILAAI
jgi:hypothetical protein